MAGITPNMLRVLAVRHGQTNWNLTGRNQGHADIPLDETGKQQAADLAKALSHERFAAIYCSPMQRVLQTVEAIARNANCEPIIDSRLIERNYGSWEGLTQSEAHSNDPERFDAYHADPTILSPPNGETGIDVFCRAGYFAADILKSHHEGTILVMSHGGTISSLIAVAIGASPATANAFRIRNCSVTEIRFLPNGRRRLVRFDDVSHLAESPIDAYSGLQPTGK
ncbi:MAG: histidine phosphatase family protein [Fimbriimonadales bacterium]|nr:histidine phosphatase family protein [Fimbriimonadales bacterium]